MSTIAEMLSALSPSYVSKTSGQKAASRKVRRAAASVGCGIERLEGRILQTVTPDPGSTFATAYNVGDPAGGQSYSDHVGLNDPIDFYAFNMSAPGTFHGRVRAYEENVEVNLFEQTGTGASATFTLLDTRVAESLAGNAPNNFDSGNFDDVLQPGKYFVKVSAEGGDTDYLVRFTPDYAGNTLATARDIGTLTHAKFYDEVGSTFADDTGGNNSYTDPLDFYKFNMARAGTFTADVALNGAFTSPLFNVRASLLNSAGATISTASPGSPLTAALGKGTYYVRVDPDGTPYPNYALTLNAQYAGSSTASATNLGDLTQSPFTASISNYVDPAQHKPDYYTFTLSQARQAITYINSYFADGSGTGAQVSIYYDKNNNGQIDSGEGVDFEFDVTNGGYSIVDDLKAGRYFVVVSNTPGGSAGNYTLSIAANPDGAGNSLATADNLGTVGGANSLIEKTDVVSNADPEDDYKFALAKPGTVNVTLAPYLGGDSNLQLIQDKNHNNQIDNGDVIAASFLPGHSADSFFKSLQPGTYFLRVVHKANDGPSAYSLSMVADVVGNTIATAADANTLTGKTFNTTDYIQQNYGPNSDTDDFYKFTLTKAGTFTAKTTGTPGEDLDIQLISDKNHNGKVDAGEVLAVSSHKDSPFENISKSLAAGTYYLRVFGVNGDTNYNLTMTD